jgi:hypothetical protein
MNSCAADLAKWIRFQLGSGAPLLQPGTFDEMRQPHTPKRGAAVEPEFEAAPAGPGGIRFDSYALGWMVQDYRGATMVYHTGGIAGFRSLIALLPDRQFGLAILVNSSLSGITRTVTQTLIDRKLGADPVNWNSAYLKLRRRAEQLDAEAERDLQAVAGGPPSIPLESFTGVFEEPGPLERISVELLGHELRMRLGNSSFQLRRWSETVFEAYLIWPYERPRSFFCRFTRDERGSMGSLQLSDGTNFTRVVGESAIAGHGT